MEKVLGKQGEPNADVRPRSTKTRVGDPLAGRTRWVALLGEVPQADGQFPECPALRSSLPTPVLRRGRGAHQPGAKEGTTDRGLAAFPSTRASGCPTRVSARVAPRTTLLAMLVEVAGRGIPR